MSNLRIARHSIRDLFAVMAIVAVLCGSFSLLPLLPGFKYGASPETTSQIGFGAGVFGALVPSIASLLHGITSARCWQLALCTTLASAWINFLVHYVYCRNESSSPQWNGHGMIGVLFIFTSPLIGFLTACFIFTLLWASLD